MFSYIYFGSGCTSLTQSSKKRSLTVWKFKTFKTFLRLSFLVENRRSACVSLKVVAKGSFRGQKNWKFSILDNNFPKQNRLKNKRRSATKKQSFSVKFGNIYTLYFYIYFGNESTSFSFPCEKTWKCRIFDTIFLKEKQRNATKKKNNFFFW